MPAELRRLKIIDLLSRTGTGVVSVRELSDLLGVSEMTIRRDLDWLEEKSILTRVHGGAIAYQSEEEKPFGDRLDDFNPQKKSIGWAAAQLVKDGDRLILDAGTTTQQVARNLECKAGLTIITNNIPVAVELSRCKHLETILLGGSLKHQELCTIGPMVCQGLAVLTVDKLFLSASGFSLKHGLTDPDMREVEVKQAMIQAANQVYLVADSSKWGRDTLARIATFQQIHKLITDDAIPKEAVIALESEGVEVITPERLASILAQNNKEM